MPIFLMQTINKNEKKEKKTVENLPNHLLSLLILFSALCLASCASTPLQAPWIQMLLFVARKQKLMPGKEKMLCMQLTNGFFYSVF